MLACGHDRSAFGVPLCAHLQKDQTPWPEYVKWFIGSGLETVLLCIPCADKREKGVPVQLDAVCEACFERASQKSGSLVGSRGNAEIRTRAEPFDTALQETTVPAEIGLILDIAPIHDGASSSWLMLVEDGSLIRMDADTRDWVRLAQSTVAPESHHEPFRDRLLRRRLHVSRSGEFAAVLNDYGRFGQVLDLRQGRITLELDGGDYHPDTVPFSFAFAQVRERLVAIHRTDWNRLDISDPASGEVLTRRGPTSYRDGEQRPEHYLDYFHGGLYLSPDGSRVLDDGWAWHPVGLPAIWSVDKWIVDNVWESENGPTLQYVCARDYYWDHAVTWIDEHRVAIGGIGNDDMHMIDGARIFDVTLQGKADPQWRTDWTWPLEITAFAGPSGLFFSDGTWLYSSDRTGLSRWDLRDGARTGHLKDFHPTRYHPRAGEFVQFGGRTLLRYKLTG